MREHGARRRGAQKMSHAALAVVLGLGPVAEVRAAEASADAASSDVQSLYESCLRQLDEGAAGAAAKCLAQVYVGLVEIDTVARTDLYYVLADVVTASLAAAATEPQALCLAHGLLADWSYRERKSPQLRLRRKVNKMSAGVQQAMRDAGVEAEACEARPLEAVKSEAQPKPSEPVPAPTPTEGATEGDAEPEEAAPAERAPVVTPARPEAPVKPAAPRAMRQLKLTAGTDLMDAGFVTTIASVGVAGLGGAMWAAKVECDARSVDGVDACGSPVPQGVRDAGLALMSVGAAGVIVGLALRWADQRRQRKLRQAPMPSVGATTVGLSWRAQF